MKVLIADDHPVVRQGLRQMLAVESDLTVVGEARNGQEVVELSRRVPFSSQFTIGNLSRGPMPAKHRSYGGYFPLPQQPRGLLP